MKASLPERLAWTAYLGTNWRGQAAFPFRSRSAIDRAQSKRLRRVIQHAYDSVPYYRETMQRRGLLPVDFRGAEDLSKLPIIERDQLQRDPQYFESTAPRFGRDIEARSGGSSGAPRVVKWDTAAVLQNAGHAERERSIIAQRVGRFVRYRESVIASRHGSEADVQHLYRDYTILPASAKTEYQHLSLADTPEENVRLLNAFKPDVIRSYGSYLSRLFRWIHSSGVEFHRPKVVFYDADELAPEARRLISDDFGIEVFSAYQAVEAFKIGFECEQHAGFHVNTDIYPVRIVDDNDNDAGDGESGQVVVSNLVNRAMVLLNYRLGDVARMPGRECICGRSLPLMSFVEGRTDDWVTLASGHTVHPQTVRTIFTAETSVRQYQVVQREPEKFSVAIEILAHDGDLESRIRRRFSENFGDVSVDVQFVDFIAPTPGGKMRPVISLVKEVAR